MLYSTVLLYTAYHHPSRTHVCLKRVPVNMLSALLHHYASSYIYFILLYIIVTLFNFGFIDFYFLLYWWVIESFNYFYNEICWLRVCRGPNVGVHLSQHLSSLLLSTPGVQAASQLMALVVNYYYTLNATITYGFGCQLLLHIKCNYLFIIKKKSINTCLLPRYILVVWNWIVVCEPTQWLHILLCK